MIKTRENIAVYSYVSFWYKKSIHASFFRLSIYCLDLNDKKIENFMKSVEYKSLQFLKEEVLNYPWGAFFDTFIWFSKTLVPYKNRMNLITSSKVTWYEMTRVSCLSVGY